MASRANHLVLLGCGLLCAAALLCAQIDRPRRGSSAGLSDAAQAAAIPARRRHRISRSRLTPAWPATPSRPASSSISTSRSSFAPSRWRTPIAWSSIFPRSVSSFRAGSRRRGTGAGQGVPLRSRHAGRVADRVRPDRAGQDRQILCAGGGQRPAAAAGARIRRGRPHRLCPVAGARKPSRTAARDRRGQCRRCAGRTRRPRRRPRSRRTRGR